VKGEEKKKKEGKGIAYVRYHSQPIAKAIDEGGEKRKTRRRSL